MPLIQNSTFKPPFYLFNGHLETIVPNVFRQVPDLSYQRERINTQDGDFLDLDFLRQGNSRLVILSHGLEGNSSRKYMKGMARTFHRNNWDVLAWNCRSCSGEINRTKRLYHHGDTKDLSLVIETVLSEYKNIVLVGFSMGGSMTLRYLGERGENVPDPVKKAVAFSVPCDLGASARELEKPANKLYLNRFLKKLKKKIKAKNQVVPLGLNLNKLDGIRTFYDFDNNITAPLHGFRNADDFYQQASCFPYLGKIRTPTLLVNSLNDPMLTGLCYPSEIAEDHVHFHLEIPGRGGHVGYYQIGKSETWAEKRALEFCSKGIN